MTLCGGSGAAIGATGQSAGSSFISEEVGWRQKRQKGFHIQSSAGTVVTIARPVSSGHRPHSDDNQGEKTSLVVTIAIRRILTIDFHLISRIGFLLV
jgi:hypothetical protein